MAKPNYSKAVLDAKEVIAVAELRAKSGLAEMLQPAIKSMISRQLDEIEQEETTVEEEFDIASLMQEVEDDASAETPEMGAEPSEEDKPISSMTSSELADFIKTAIQDVIAGKDAGEVDSTEITGDEPSMDEPSMDEPEEGSEEDDEDLDELDSILMELDLMNEKCDDSEEEPDTLQEQVNRLKAENAKLKKDVKVSDKKLLESNLLMTQLIYANRLIAENQLSENQIVKFAQILEGAKTSSEVKGLYEAITESLTINKPKKVEQKSTPKQLKESWGLDGKAILPNTQKPQGSSNPLRDKMMKNAGIRSK